MTKLDRETLKIVVVGHVDHGKSTLIGRLLYDTKSLPEGAIDRVKRISKEKGKPFEYAYLLDAFEEEQKQGITIDTTQIQFFTQKRDYVIIDAPGHKEFLKNMVSGAASAEAAILIIDANEGIQEQSKRHGYILSLLGIKNVYVVVNKMDLIGYSEEKFHAIQQKMNVFLNSLQVYPQKYIPISAFKGENITKSSKKMTWYQGETVLAALDLFEKAKGLEEKPLRFPIQDVYKFDNRRIIAGRIEDGTLNVGDEILISPGNKVTKVKTIEYWQEKDKTESAAAGMSVGITVTDEFFNKRGEIISHKEASPLVSNTFKANIFWLGKNQLESGKSYKLKLAAEEVECKIVTINKVVDASTLEIITDRNYVKTNDVAEVIIKTKHKIAFDEFKHSQNTGRFVLVEGYDVSGGGIISGAATLKDEQDLPEITATAGEVSRLVTRAEREKELRQQAKIILVQGASFQENLDEAAKLEKKLFATGEKVYFLDISSRVSQGDGLADWQSIVEIIRTLLDNGIIIILAEHGNLGVRLAEALPLEKIDIVD